MHGQQERDKSWWWRLWRYQDERFPVLAHGLLIAAFAGAAVCVSVLAREAAVRLPALAVAFVVLFGLFLQLRIADEHKDFADDSRHRPERAVPRGLVSLAELRGIAWVMMALQLGLVMWLDWKLVIPLLLAWSWMGLMTVEFFVPDWLRARPLLYLLSHMISMPLFALLATACDWVPATADTAILVAPVGYFLLLSFFSGVAIEVGRKCYAPDAERNGVETYSKLWGAGRAGLATAAALLATTAAAIGCVRQINPASTPVIIALVTIGVMAVSVALAYARTPTKLTSKGIELAAGLHALAVYLLVGPLALLLR